MATKIEPTIGRVLWYWPATVPAYDQGQFNSKDPFTCQVCFVHKDGSVNVAGYKHNGDPFAARYVAIHQEGDDRPKGNFCEWMPYQKGQAAKTEALEKQVSGDPPTLQP